MLYRYKTDVPNIRICLRFGWARQNTAQKADLSLALRVTDFRASLRPIVAPVALAFQREIKYHQ
jgi:hypothetical protein